MHPRSCKGLQLKKIILSAKDLRLQLENRNIADKLTFGQMAFNKTISGGSEPLADPRYATRSVSECDLCEQVLTTDALVPTCRRSSVQCTIERCLIDPLLTARSKARRVFGKINIELWEAVAVTT